MTNAQMYEPRPPRFGIHHRSTLVRADGSESAVTITNVSQTGFRLHMSATPQIGQRVVLRSEGGDVPAQIRWAVGKDAGGVFLRPLDD